MKRFLAGFIIAMILFCNVTTTYIGYSAEVIIEQGIDYLYKGWDMIYSLINGGVIQTSPYQGIADQATAVAAFYEDWGTDLLKAINYIVPSDDAIINSQSAITFPLKLGMTRKYYNDFISNYLNYAVDDTNGFKAALTGDALAAWNRYNYNWINRYLNAFSDDSPTATPDPQFATFLDRINGSGFYFKNFVNGTTTSGQATAGYPNFQNYYPNSNYSWFVANSNEFGIDNSTICACSDIVNINIVQQSGNYFFSITVTALPAFNGYYQSDGHNYYSGQIRSSFAGQSNIIVSDSGINNSGTYFKSSPHSHQFTYSGSLGQCLDYISKNIKNVNIYVDGVLWSYVGGSEPTFTAPDVITNSDGVVLGHDVYFPEQDLYIDLITWRNLLEDKIADGDTIDFDDLIDGGVIVDGNDIPITDEDQETLFTKKDASLVIDIGLDDADTSDLLPDAPSPPDDDPTDWDFPEFPIPDLVDGEDPKSTGLTVLARIINVTNQSLPPELISMFWGICISLVILGIIKILHK